MNVTLTHWTHLLNSILAALYFVILCSVDITQVYDVTKTKLTAFQHSRKPGKVMRLLLFAVTNVTCNPLHIHYSIDTGEYHNTVGVVLYGGESCRHERLCSQTPQRFSVLNYTWVNISKPLSNLPYKNTSIANCFWTTTSHRKCMSYDHFLRIFSYHIFFLCMR